MHVLQGAKNGVQDMTNGSGNAVNGNCKASADEGSQEDDSEEEEEKLEPEEAVKRYIRGKPPRGLPDFLSALKVPGGRVGRMKVFYAAMLRGSHARIEERLQANDKYILAMAQDDKFQAAQLVALEHYLTVVGGYHFVLLCHWSS